MRASSEIPGKWFIFWCKFIRYRISGFIYLSVHQTSQSPIPYDVCTFHPSSSATSSTIGYCVSLTLIIMFLVFKRYGNLATGIILGELSQSIFWLSLLIGYCLGYSSDISSSSSEFSDSSSLRLFLYLDAIKFFVI